MRYIHDIHNFFQLGSLVTQSKPLTTQAPPLPMPAASLVQELEHPISSYKSNSIESIADSAGPSVSSRCIKYKK